MIDPYGINPVAEAMVYYWGRVNGSSVEKRLTDAIKAYPSLKAELSRSAEPALAIQKELDSLEVNGDLLKKYFRSLGNLDFCAPFGFCLSSLLLQYHIVDRLELSPDRFFNYVAGLDSRNFMYGLCFGLIDKYDSLFLGDDLDAFFSKRLESLSVSIESKWSILNAAFTAKQHIEELRSILIPAANIIMSNPSLYNNTVSAFTDRYSCCSVETLEAHFGHKLNTVNIMKVAPLILAFDSKCAIIESEDGSEGGAYDPPVDSPLLGRMFLGVSKYLTADIPNKLCITLSDRLKTLSDSTRLEILFFLCHNRAYGQELCEAFSLQRSALSYHISKLTSAGFITGEISGGKTYYSANKKEIEAVLDQIRDELRKK